MIFGIYNYMKNKWLAKWKLGIMARLQSSILRIKLFLIKNTFYPFKFLNHENKDREVFVEQIDKYKKYYGSIVSSMIIDTDNLLNKTMGDFKGKIIELKNLIASGGTSLNMMNVEKVNKSMMDELKRIYERKYENAQLFPIEIRAISQETAEVMISKIEDYLLRGNGVDLFIKDVLYPTLVFNPTTSIVKFNPVENLHEPALGVLIEEYISNYLATIENGECPSKWKSCKELELYLAYAEGRVLCSFEQNESALFSSALCDIVYENFSPIGQNEDIFIQIDKMRKSIYLFSEDSGKIVKERVQENLNELLARVEQKTFESVEKINNTIFPEVMKQRLEEIREGNNVFFASLVESLDALEDKRYELESELGKADLFNFFDYITRSGIDPSTEFSNRANTYKETISLINTLYEDSLYNFISERKKFFKNIEEQYKEDGEYSKIITKTKNHISKNKIDSDFASEVELLLLNAVNSLAADLENTFIGRLDLTYSSFLNTHGGSTIRSNAENLALATKNTIIQIKKDSINKVHMGITRVMSECPRIVSEFESEEGGLIHLSNMSENFNEEELEYCQRFLLKISNELGICIKDLRDLETVQVWSPIEHSTNSKQILSHVFKGTVDVAVGIFYFIKAKVEFASSTASGDVSGYLSSAESTMNSLERAGKAIGSIKDISNHIADKEPLRLAHQKIIRNLSEDALKEVEEMISNGNIEKNS